LKETRLNDVPAHQYTELNEGLHIDLFKAFKQESRFGLEGLKIAPIPNPENPCAQLLEKETFHDIDELM